MPRGDGCVGVPVSTGSGRDASASRWPTGHGAPWAEAIPGAEFRIIPGAGHAVVVENPTAVATLAQGFFSRLDSRG